MQPCTILKSNPLVYIISIVSKNYLMLVIGIQQCLCHTPQNLIAGWKDCHSQLETENPIHLEWLAISQQVQ